MRINYLSGIPKWKQDILADRIADAYVEELLTCRNCRRPGTLKEHQRDLEMKDNLDIDLNMPICPAWLRFALMIKEQILEYIWLGGETDTDVIPLAG